MQVREAMSTDPKVINPGTTVREAASSMERGDFGALPVGENDKLVGMVTDRDIALRCVGEGSASPDGSVRDIMSKDIAYCYDDVELGDAARVMAENQVQRLPVINRDKRLVGMLGMADLARHDASALSSAYEGVAQPSGGSRSL